MQADVTRGWLNIRVDKSCDGITTFQFMRDVLHLPDKFAAQICNRGFVRIRSRAVEMDTCIEAGQTLFIADPADIESTSAEPVTMDVHLPQILFEDAHVLVVAKQSGIIVHSSDEFEPTLDKQVSLYYQMSGLTCRVLHAHRLDKGTTGAVVYAKHGLMARALDAQIVSRKMRRTYLAVTCGRKWPREKIIEAAIGRDRHRSGLYRVSSTGKPARTHVKVVAESFAHPETLTLLTCHLDTGRTHQIRVHTSYMSAPIVGDTSYGGNSSIEGFPKSGAIGLHAAEVAFDHPYDEKKVVVEAPVDDDWQSFFRQQWGIEADF